MQNFAEEFHDQALIDGMMGAPEKENGSARFWKEWFLKLWMGGLMWVAVETGSRILQSWICHNDWSIKLNKEFPFKIVQSSGVMVLATLLTSNRLHHFGIHDTLSLRPATRYVDVQGLPEQSTTSLRLSSEYPLLPFSKRTATMFEQVKVVKPNGTSVLAVFGIVTMSFKLWNIESVLIRRYLLLEHWMRVDVEV
jgi:hypothetical protein